MLKKLFCLLLAFTVCIGASACRRRDDDSSGGNIETGDIAEGVTISENGKEVYFGDSKDGKKRIKIAFADTGYGSDWLKVIGSHFVKENPEYWIYLDGDPGLTELVSTQLSTGYGLPDIYMPLGSLWQSYALNDWMEELSDVYNQKPDGESGKTIYDKMDPAWQDYCTAINGGEYGKYVFPWAQTITGIVYNETLFAKYGWSIPTTNQELLALCEKIKTDTNNKVAPFVYPGKIKGYFDFMGMTYWLQASGVDGLKEFYRFESVEVYNYNQQPGSGKLQALEAFTEVFGPDVNYSLKGSMSLTHTEAQIAFLNGSAAMTINGSWLEREMINDLKTSSAKMRMMPFPSIESAQKDENGNYIKVNYGAVPDYMFIPKAAPEKDGAKKFIAFTAKEEMLCLFAKYTGSPRPFECDYDETVAELSDFVQDCFRIRSESVYYFPSSKSPLYVKNYVQPWYTGNPYIGLVNGPDKDGYTPSRYIRMQYQEAKASWNNWMTEIS